MGYSNQSRKLSSYEWHNIREGGTNSGDAMTSLKSCPVVYESAYVLDWLKQDLPGCDQRPAGSDGERLRDLAIVLKNLQGLRPASDATIAPKWT
jgi:hypothetical protein